MSSKKIIAILLIVAGIALGINGFNTISDSSASIEVLDIKIDASNESGQSQGILQIGLAILLFGGGVYTLNKK